jgi:hypothetical protein
LRKTRADLLRQAGKAQGTAKKLLEKKIEGLKGPIGVAEADLKARNGLVSDLQKRMSAAEQAKVTGEKWIAWAQARLDLYEKLNGKAKLGFELYLEVAGQRVVILRTSE